ncbi:succinate dehydrogenase cytochrome b558 subunit [Pullulanibacillus sp. KACC 23026]|uniref:succinate dehydrogenase cytochrome b558 subunit n=1 Tax=Pullulanibacillus sp. KACC 23026 TaxID=3028315 RepID=UPI0023AE8DA9|nr:succinate dehydrogenase cytochrome b558 subunit [Pullulanibacillus sp. KACC 23026]WEG13947.1 succinate dehydrogenase cytochrome b558 subunit [Pullulanibacillus sp. KACC 23026]
MAQRDFVSRRLHSFLGLIPIGLFLVVHLTVNFYATGGAQSFNQAANFMENLPYLIFLEIVLIYLPLLFHAIYGIYIAFQAKTNVNRFKYYRNWLFFFQRWTGLFLVIFLAWHIWETRVQMALGEPLDFSMMQQILSNPWMCAFYIVGVLSAVFHFSNGLWAFMVHWGITVSPKSQKAMAYVSVIIFVLLAIVGVSAVFAFVGA